MIIEIKERENTKKAESYRKEGYIPGVIYGADIGSIPVYIDKDIFKKNLKNLHQRFEFIFNGKKFIGILQEIQKHPISLEPIHFDIYIPSLKEEITTTIPLIFKGEEELLRNGYILNKSLTELEVEAKIAELPEFIEIDISALKPGESLYVKDLKISKSIKILVDPNTPIASVILPEETTEESS